MYRALYRKYRPQKCADVVGQAAITPALLNQITANKVGHAYMFTGTRGTGKTTCAKIFSKAINCENPIEAEPCGVCIPCVGLDNGSILDVIEIDAASNNGVDDIRDLREETAYRPSRCKYKVYIIDEVHMLSTQAFNALLKIMEEPPSHVVFILATTDIHKVPATILSRCQRFDFMRIPAEKMAERILFVCKQEGIEIEEQAADLIARLADGALRDALSLLDTCSSTGEVVTEKLVRQMAGVADKGYLFTISKAVVGGDVKELLAIVSSLREKSIDVKRLTEELVSHYRNILMALVQPDGSLLGAVPADEKEKYLSHAPEVGEASAIFCLRRLAASLDKMSRSPDPRVELELALFDLSMPAPVLNEVVNTAPKQQTAPVIQPAPLPSTSPVQHAIQPTTAGVPLVAPQASENTNVPIITPATNKPVELTENEKTDIVAFTSWPDIVTNMATKNKMLHSYMKDSTAYTDGKRILIDGGDMFLSYMREYEEAAETIKQVIQDVTGIRYGIGPYKNKVKSNNTTVTAQDTLANWQAKGVPVEYE